VTRPRILVAGIGNVFLGDDAFGVEVARRLADRPLPEGVRVEDFGIRGIDLAYALEDGWETVVLVDAAPRGGPPGTLYVIEPDPAPGGGEGPGPSAAGDLPALDAHGLDPAKVLGLAAALGVRPPRILLVGCEPGPEGPGEDLDGELSPPVRAAVEEAIPLVESLVIGLLDGERSETSASGAAERSGT
jgi:hydrogenase maturation protease